MTTKILLHGSGAIGTIYFYLLHKAGYDVTATCRSNYMAASTDGFVIDSEKYGNDLHFRPKVVSSPAEAEGPFDYVIVTTKALPDAEISKTVGLAVTKGKTTIVLIQNGIGIEDEYAHAFPGVPLLSCVVYLPSTQTSPGRIQMGTFESLEVGTFPASAYEEQPEVKASTDRFIEMFSAAGSDVKRYPDVQAKRWNKLLLNAPWNPICALTLSRDVAFLTSCSEAEKLVESVMLEVAAIAQKLGHEGISASAAKEQLKRAGGRVGGKGIEPSMLVDVLNSRRMEVEVILGNPVRLARQLDVDVPRLETLYVLLKALDEATAFRQPGRSLSGLDTRVERDRR